MKRNIHYLWLIVIGILALQVSCKKNSTGPESPPPSQPAPEITSIEPDSGQAGDQVTITGKNFSSTESENTVKFAGVTATVNSASTTQLVATVPNDAGSGTVEVTVNGQSATGPDFTLLMAPEITAIEPDSAITGAQFRIIGKHFSSDPSQNIVIFAGGVQATNIYSASATTIELQVPQGVQSGPITVEVNDLTATSPMEFTLKTYPTVTGFTPASAKYGELVTITGENFGPTLADNRVEFGIGPAVIVSASETELVVEVPKAAGTGAITVRNHHNLNAGTTDDFVYELTVTVSTVAGTGAAGYVDGDVSVAQFNKLTGIDIDNDGNLYIADSGNHVIRKVSVDGLVSTFAGTGIAGFKNGSVNDAQFNYPHDLTLDEVGNIYVADASNHSIRKIFVSSMEVITLSGNGSPGFVNNGDGALAGYNFPTGIETGTNGDIYVVDRDNHAIRKVSQGGGTTTLVGNGSAGFADGSGSDARFYQPTKLERIVQDLYITDKNNHRIRKANINSGVVTTLSGVGTNASTDGPLHQAEHSFPFSISEIGYWGMYAGDDGTSKVRLIANNEIVTIAGSGGGFVDGDGSNAKFKGLVGMVVQNEGRTDHIYLADWGNNAIRRITVE